MPSLQLLSTTLLISLSIQVFFFIFAATFKTDKLTDLSYGLTFITLTLFLLATLPSPQLIQTIAALLIIIWGLRLTSYLFIRILIIKKDHRFDTIRTNPLKFIQFWLLQGLSVWIIMLPSIIILSSTSPFSLHPVTLMGFTLWFLGFTLETVADLQKFFFKLKPQNKDQFISHGLWKYSRHPNYFGEILCWWGIFTFALPYLSSWSWATIISPLYITILLLFVTGIPPLEKRYSQKYKHNKHYQQYRSSTSLLIPLSLKK
jgi:steroid 5-alpha reductase family enzyme